MVYSQQGHVLRWGWLCMPPRGLKRDYSGISKACKPICIRTMARAGLKTFTKAVICLWHHYPPRPAQLGIYDQNTLWGYFCSLSLLNLLHSTLFIHRFQSYKTLPHPFRCQSQVRVVFYDSNSLAINQKFKHPSWVPLICSSGSQNPGKLDHQFIIKEHSTGTARGKTCKRQDLRVQSFHALSEPTTLSKSCSPNPVLLGFHESFIT